MPVAIHTRQTSHLPNTASQGANALNPRNYAHKFGSYYETFIRDGEVRFRRSFYASPPFAWEVEATSTGDCSYPWAYILPWRRIVLLFVRGGTDTWISYSDSEGETWEAPVPGIAGAVKPYGVVDPFDGTELIAAFVTASGKIQALRRYAGAAAYEAPFFFKDSTLADLLFEDDTFSFWIGYEGPARLMGHFHIKTETATSTWFSADFGETWTRFI